MTVASRPRDVGMEEAEKCGRDSCSLRIHEFDSARDLMVLRRCIVELQEVERGYDARRRRAPRW